MSVVIRAVNLHSPHYFCGYGLWHQGRHARRVQIDDSLQYLLKRLLWAVIVGRLVVLDRHYSYASRTTVVTHYRCQRDLEMLQPQLNIVEAVLSAHLHRYSRFNECSQ